MPEYPGLGLPLRHLPQRDFNIFPIGSHGNCSNSDSGLLPVREVAMMIIMDRLMDKPNWEKKIFDDEIVARWRKEALDYPDDSLWQQATGGKDPNRQIESNWATRGIKPLIGIISDGSFDFCVKELRNKSQHYEQTGLVPTLDADASVVKSDRLVTSDLQFELRKAFNKLKLDQSASADWHPGSNDMVQDLIHPSMYPLVYGRSRVFKEEVVGVEDAIDKWAGKGDIIRKIYNEPVNDRYETGVGGSQVPPSFWSDKYQWLPSNVAFQEDGTVKFTSYINNLHPNKYADIYRTIEKLIVKALPAWDQCLALSTDYTKKTGAGRLKSRFCKPDNPDDENAENWNPSNPVALADVQVNFEEDHEYDHVEDETDRKWHILRTPNQPEPDPFTDDKELYVLPESHQLSKKFKDSGLQIIVKMASIELTPEKPEFPVGGWHVEGQMNERICATALYYIDSENISTTDLSFRMQTSAYMEEEYNVGQDCYYWMQAIYGTLLGGGNAPCLQNYGSVETREGRLLAFPNVFQHRVSPFRLTDPTKPGHRRFIALWLVDPHARIISTANVPPQQQDWWAESILGKSDESRASALSNLPFEIALILKEKGVDIESNAGEERPKLPIELREMVSAHLNAEGGNLLMSEQEAKMHREKLMEVRGAFHDAADEGWHQHSYSFCEH